MALHPRSRFLIYKKGGMNMNYERLYTAVELMHGICLEINEESIDNIEYVVLQGIDEDDVYSHDPFIAHKIADFYNRNWLGNADFMHIPNFKQVKYNCDHYPIIIARVKDTKEIIGISTIKYDENKDNKVDPYYPFYDEKYFSITGILTKKDSHYRGIGKKIYEIAIRGYHKFNEIYNDTSLTCVIDCRNKNSINAIYAATKKINTENLAPFQVASKIVGFYTVTDPNHNMLEAPTIVVKINDDEISCEKRDTLEYIKPNDGDLFRALLITLKNYLQSEYIKKPIINIDEEAGIVSYYEINNSKVLPNVISNNTEDGNDRIPNEAITNEEPFKLMLIKNRKEHCYVK